MAEVDGVQAKAVFKTLALFVYGYASMLANNEMAYDEKTIAAELENMLYGAVAAAKCSKRVHKEFGNMEITAKEKKAKILTLTGIVVICLMTLTKIIPSTNIAGYSVFAGLVFFFIVEAVAFCSNLAYNHRKYRMSAISILRRGHYSDASHCPVACFMQNSQ